jgi:glycolate oxidase iron-sulfur subunit
MNDKYTPETLAQSVDRLASQCVKCGLCLPHCPTYFLAQDENESPRGRIALFQALSKNQLPYTPKVKNHLDQCLGCRACEPVCPAHVEYGQLLTLGRTLQNTLPAAEPLAPTPLVIRTLRWLVQKPRLQRFFHKILWLSQITGVRALAHTLKLPALFGLQRLESLLPWVEAPRPIAPFYPAIGKKQGAVMLFTGCTAWCDQKTLTATLFVLQKFGYEVHIPAQQTCCGAIALHAGEAAVAAELAQKNVQAFVSERSDIKTIITFATGCSAVLQEYEAHFSLGANSTKDILSFLLSCEWPADLVLQPLDLKILLHTPCTRRNVLKSSADPAQLLNKIPQLTVTSVKTTYCCGAAGTYVLEHPDFAVPLAKNILSELDDIQANFIATSNIGCALHLEQQLRNLNSSITVGHPIVLLAKALGF